MTTKEMFEEMENKAKIFMKEKMDWKELDFGLNISNKNELSKTLENDKKD